MNIIRFDDTAENYDKYRDDYQNVIFELLRREFSINNSKRRLLDLGCGTGRLSIALHEDFEEIIALDISANMLEEGKKRADSLGIKNIKWIESPAENITHNLGKFQLVVCGEAFHWMNREKVVDIIYDLLSDDGCFAILGAGGALGRNQGVWQNIVNEKIEKWLGKRETPWKKGKALSHEGILQYSKFQSIKSGIFNYHKSYRINEILGFLYTTSYCNKKLLGDNISDFEADMKDSLLKINPGDEFTEEREAFYIFAKKNNHL